MGDMDQGIKRLLQAAPEELLKFVLGDCEFLGMLPTDAAIEAQLVLDSLFAINYQSEKCGANIEIQSSGEPDMPQRCFEYAQRAGFLHKRKIISIVFWLRKIGTFPKSDTYEIRVGDRLLGTWNIISIKVFELQARDIIRSGIIPMLPLVPFMQGADLPTIEDAAKVVQQQAPAEEATMLNTLLAVFTAQFHGKSAAEALAWRLGMSEKIVEESPLYQAWITKAREEGEAIGETKGEAKGKLSGMRQAILRALEGRFGVVSPDLVVAVQTADEPTLDAVILHVATESLEELRARFGLA